MPRFLERDEAEREPPCDQVSLGRRAQRAAVLALRHGRRRRGLLMRASARSSAWGVPIASVDIATVVPHFRTREPFVDGEPGQRRPDSPRSAAQADARATLAAHPGAAISSAWPRPPPSTSCTTTLPLDPAQRHDAVAAGLRRTGLGDDRDAVGERPPQHGAKCTACSARSTKSSAASRAASTSSVLDEGLSDRDGQHAQLLPARRRARRRAAEQLARRALALGAGDGAEDAARAQAWQRRAVDAAPHDPGLRQGRGCRPTSFGYYPTDHAGGNEILRSVRARHGVRRRRLDEALEGATRASKCTALATARSSSAPTSPTTGSATST